ncbi:MAG: ABC transporter substrate-binding protein, partial [candidate division NC10 bacterium]
STIPIVMVASGDPVASKFVASLNRPGGNMTGLSYYATELTAKRLELLKEMAPQIGRIAVLANPHLAYLPFLDDTKRAARALGVQLQVLEVGDPGELDRAFVAMAGERAEALFVLPDPMLGRQGKRIADLALRHRLPMMSWGTWFAETGGLMTYSTDYPKLSRRAATYAHRILTGARPGDLPVEQPTTFSLVINLKTAKALGRAIPPSLLLRADRVIE